MWLEPQSHRRHNERLALTHVRNTEDRMRRLALMWLIAALGSVSAWAGQDPEYFQRAQDINVGAGQPGIDLPLINAAPAYADIKSASAFCEVHGTSDTPNGALIRATINGYDNRNGTLIIPLSLQEVDNPSIPATTLRYFGGTVPTFLQVPGGHTLHVEALVNGDTVGACHVTVFGQFVFPP